MVAYGSRANSRTAAVVYPRRPFLAQRLQPLSVSISQRELSTRSKVIIWSP